MYLLRDYSKARQWVDLAQWDKCHICGASFSTWPQLRDHRRKHTLEEIDHGLKEQDSTLIVDYSAFLK